jgi:phosphatidylserine decarboxylase
MDPFVVISFGKKAFRTRVIRHSRNPVWDEKLLFHVRKYETSYKVLLTVLDWDKLSSNDHIGDVALDVKELIDNTPQPGPQTGLYKAYEEEGATGEKGEKGMTQLSLPLSTAKEMPREAKHNPLIRFK